ncbi:hypothetical protein Cyast_1019 [Cyanobacterium stanieri PCC 7202]|uniref:Uncharacterized protein n=1 Tax=Cyanobacterium stanieri (strain ATCC 29140 / PCC 7202) TaxID=292563 RepID=K9YLK1_CYASC|nr:hypothetical protein Cyast_1019 [Cyanobacterium stanieri PCC 7202]
MLFTKETPILYYEPQPREKWLKREYILFPAYYYRVLAPRVSTRKINILEKAVLGICRVGSFSAEEIGEKLDIGKDLSALIIKELQTKGFVDTQGLITKRGKKALENEFIDTENLTAGYVFQEPWQGELFPRLIENLENAETRFNENGFPELSLGTTGKPFYQRIFMPLPIHNTLLSKPKPLDILKAIKLHSQSLAYQNSQNDPEMDDPPWMLEKSPNLKRITFIEEEPHPVWLATFIYIPESNFKGFNTNNWQVCDPFGLGNSPWLYRHINKSLNTSDNSTLLRAIDNLLKNNNQEIQTQEKHQDWMIYYQEATDIVESKLNLDIVKWDSLYQGLITLEIPYLEIELSNNSMIEGNKYNYFVNSKLETILIQCQKIIENIFLIIADKYPLDKCWKRLDKKDKQHNKIILEEIVDTIGFTENNNKIKIPKTLLSVDQNQIKLASDYHNGSLRSYLIATLITAYNQPQHPLYFFAEKIPDLLFQLDELAGLRNKSSHYSSSQLNQTLVTKKIDLVYQLVDLFLQNNHQNTNSEEEIIYA